MGAKEQIQNRWCEQRESLESFQDCDKEGSVIEVKWESVCVVHEE